VTVIPDDTGEFHGMRVTVMGLGSFGGGGGAAKYLAGRGALVTVTDLKTARDLAVSIEALQEYDIRFVLGGHDMEDFTGADLVVASPAVPRESPYLEAARRAGVRLHTEVGLFVERCPAPVCGVTGSNGKTTTVSMIGEALAHGGVPYHLGGNIGGSLLAELPRIAPDDRVVLEISSFQIEWLDELGWSPRIAALLNIMPNHLDRHGTLEAYTEVKAKILAHQEPGDTAVIVTDDPGARAITDRVRGKLIRVGRDIAGDGLTLEGSWIVRKAGGRTERVFDTARLQVPGAHNVSNALAAVACALEMGAPPEGIADGLASFRGMPHRLELVGEIGGVRFFNDSKATTPEAAAVGVAAFGERVIPILGGYDKGVSFEEMARGIAGKVRWAALIGATAPKIRSALESAGVASIVFGTLGEALRACADRAAPGDVVLLSPGCASYDMFNNYEERGEAFRELVRRLETGESA
jgi:UDP-N-acetylmuramoylalanine--D-glutamate ligase